jgi:hypothetical protein
VPDSLLIRHFVPRNGPNGLFFPRSGNLSSLSGGETCIFSRVFIVIRRLFFKSDKLLAGCRTCKNEAIFWYEDDRRCAHQETDKLLEEMIFFKRSIPLRMRALTVPSGSSRREAISCWVSPLK